VAKKLKVSEQKMKATLADIEKEKNPFVEKQAQREAKMKEIKATIEEFESRKKSIETVHKINMFWTEGFGNKRGMLYTIKQYLADFSRSCFNGSSRGLTNASIVRKQICRRATLRQDSPQS